MSLVGHWRFDGDTTDQSRFDNDGSGSPTYVTGKIDQAINGDGSTITVPQSESIQSALTGDTMTLSLWWKQTGENTWRDLINFTDTDNSTQRLERGASSSPNDADLWCNFGAGVGGSNIDLGSIGVPLDEWFHLVVRRDGDDYEIWVNGELEVSETRTTKIEIDSDLFLNASGTASELDDVRLYDHAISDKRIVQLSRAKILHYTFNADTDDVGDVSGYRHSGPIQGPDYISTNVVGSGAYSFVSGNNDNIPVRRLKYDSSGQLPELTLTAWIRVGSSGQIIHSWDRSEFWRFGVGGSTSSNSIDIGLRDDAGVSDISASTDVTDGEWHHVAFVYDRGDVTFYVDGVSDYTTSTGGSAIGANLQRYGYIGSYTESSTYDAEGGGSFDGDMAEVEIYHSALSASEIQSRYEQRASIDDSGQLYGKEVSEPETKLVMDNRTFNATSNEYQALGSTTPIVTDYSDWVEDDDTLGDIYLTGWVYVTDTTYTPTTFEFTKLNNEQGFYMYFQNAVVSNPDSWQQGWNYVVVPLDSYDLPSDTPWSNMDRVQLYRSGPDSGDSSQSITYKDIQLKKLPSGDTRELQVQENGRVHADTVTEVGPGSDALVGWWPLDPSINDHSVNTNNGNNNGSTVAGGPMTSSRAFDASNNDHITVDAGAGTGLQFGGDVTYSVWLYHNSPLNIDDTNNYRRVFSYGQNNDSSLVLEHNGQINPSVNIDGARSGYRTNSITLDSWEHIVFSYNSKTDEMTTYLNGSMIEQTTVATGSRTPEATTFYISDGYRAIDGRMRDMRIYNRVLSTDEVAQLYALTGGDSNTSVLQANDGATFTARQFDERL